MYDYEDKCFYVLDGGFEFQVDGEADRATPGTFLYLPRGTSHSFRNVGGTAARAFGLVTPSGVEHFFGDIARACADGLPDPGTLQAVGRAHGIKYV